MFDQDHIAEAIAWRHDLHRHPELGFEEHRTSEMIAGLLTDWGWRVHRGLAGTGVVAQMGQGAPVIGLRADIDALPIVEATGAAHASTLPGKMHACGHDGHTAMLLLAARQIAAEGVETGTITLIFQPAEESDGGARVMIEQGLFSQFPCDKVFGIHNWPGVAPGRFVARDDKMMAAFSVFDIEILGKGGHGAMPEQSDGVIAAAGRTAAALQEIPARALSPLEPGVVSVTQIHSGSAYNVCPDRAVVSGTCRWFGAEAGDIIEDRLRRVASAEAAAQGCTANIDYQRRYPATINTAPEAALAREVAADMGLDTSMVGPSMASEDFAFMLNEVPGAYLWLGAAREGENPGLHSAKFDFNDAVLPAGAEFWVRLARRATQG
ncbi:MAG: amidohydrolase [Rhodobacteraceae bacterium]|jgi:amidohydrolase|uniref:Hippurate hydrolase n=1 Tax=Salipiger profundus TaxID=1229727 RepID=A0A1U7D9B8_9RHOB|nr:MULTISPECIES: amidohydrolase [Salipiger]APX24761.1 hippurate hydrolase [Salipiger profundus]MAB07682.1 amidohydrolase [Paracoccaceae bacterium]GFZ97591.1 amidohydrolase [Salipiger profundus]SFC99959.1 hippurate hydrolase [Salipiger profundus]